MKALITASGQIGPFAKIERIEEGWLAGACIYPDGVIGAAIIDDYTPPPPPPPTPPAEITMRQARLALLGAGKLAAVDAAIATMPEPNKTAAKIEWEYSNSVLRHNGFVSALGPMLGLTEAQIDALFIAGAKL